MNIDELIKNPAIDVMRFLLMQEIDAEDVRDMLDRALVMAYESGRLDEKIRRLEEMA